MRLSLSPWVPPPKPLQAAARDCPQRWRDRAPPKAPSNPEPYTLMQAAKALLEVLGPPSAKAVAHMMDGRWQVRLSRSNPNP